MKAKHTQEEFRIMARCALIEKRMTDESLAKLIGRSRTTVNLAINKPGRNPTKWMIDRALNLGCF